MCDICESRGIDYEARWPWAACAPRPQPSESESQSEMQPLIAAIQQLTAALERKKPADSNFVFTPQVNRWSAS